jgi:two-component system nitrogen regulation response regulator NtrX
MKGKVLVVEDYMDWRELLSGLLKREGHDVTAVSTLDDAIAYVDDIKDLDLAIVDIRLVETDESNEDGMKLLSHIRKHQPFTRVIMITGHGNMETQRKAFKDFQAFDFFRKEQFDSDEFKAGFREAVEQAAHERKAWNEEKYIKGRRFEDWQREND